MMNACVEIGIISDKRRHVHFTFGTGDQQMLDPATLIVFAQQCRDAAPKSLTPGCLPGKDGIQGILCEIGFIYYPGALNPMQIKHEIADRYADPLAPSLLGKNAQRKVFYGEITM
jgi:hypothetical protein